MCTFAAIFVFAFISFGVINGQLQPHWGEIQCDMSLTDKYPGGVKYTYYNRWYTFTPSYSSLLPRNVKVKTCTEDKEGNREVFVNTYLYLSPTKLSALDERVIADSAVSCDDGEIGAVFSWTNISPNYVYEIPVQPVFGTAPGGTYKLTIECEEPSLPSTEEATKSSNITSEFPYYDEWVDGGEMKISCDANAAGMTNLSANGEGAIYEFEITQYAQELAFTTCDPETAFNTVDDEYINYNSDITSGRLSSYTITVWYGEEQRDTGIQIDTWRWDSDSEPSDFGYSSSCITNTYGDAYGDPSVNDNKWKLSPGKYYVQIKPTSSANDGYYVLSMLCWNNDAIKEAVAGIDYQQATPSPTGSPITFSPSPSPTERPTVTDKSLTEFPTVQPTSIPTVVYVGPDSYNSERKSIYKGTISCGLYVHDYLEKKRLNWYKFVVTEDMNYFSFDTCKDDLTDFTACTTLYYLNGNGGWSLYDASRVNGQNPECDYCNGMHPELPGNNLPAGTYAIAIYGETFEKNIVEDYGEYILRMSCPLPEDEGKVVPVLWETAEPTPSPTGILDIPSKDGTNAGDIGCGVVLQGETAKSSNGKLHRFEVINGGLDWVKISTCDDTSFFNYLFVYDYYNQSGHESYSFGRRDNSLGFHYESRTTCNEIVINDLSNGIYYVKIEGYNYFFDYGTYTLSMTCSDGNAVRAANNYDEYVKPLEWWVILLIVLSCLLCCAICIFAGCWYKRKQGGGGGAVGTSSPGAEMT